MKESGIQTNRGGAITGGGYGNMETERTYRRSHNKHWSLRFGGFNYGGYGGHGGLEIVWGQVDAKEGVETEIGVETWVKGGSCGSVGWRKSGRRRGV